MMEERISNDELREWAQQIEDSSLEWLVNLQRFARAGHPVFDKRYPLYKIFGDRLESLGGITSEISKKVGWLE